MVSRQSTTSICCKTTQLSKKGKSSSASNGVIDIAGFTLSDLEDDNEENFEGLEFFM